MGRRRLKLFLIESTVDWIEGSKNLETCALDARKFGCKFGNRMGINLPGQCQPPGLDSTVGIVVSWGAKLDIMIRLTVRSRKGLLNTVIKPQGKRCQVIGGVEFGILQLGWLWVERSGSK